MMLGRFFRCLLFAIVLLISLPVFSQKKVAKPSAPKLVPYAAVDKLTLQIPDSAAHSVKSIARYINASFSTEADKARAAFVWVAKNIRYDVESLYLIRFFRESEETVQETLSKRAGVCSNYAELYNAIAQQTGLKSHVVHGYTKAPDGAMSVRGHAWCATKINGQWFLMDPTWAAGYVVEEYFVPRLNNAYFRVQPTELIRTHMPFDPIWQLLPSPYTTYQFQRGMAPGHLSPLFNFADSIAVFEQQSFAKQLRAVSRRIEQNGVKNDITFKYLSDNKLREEKYYITLYNDGVHASNAGGVKLNEFIEFFNHQFLPKKTDADLQLLLPPIAADFARARELILASRNANPMYSSLTPADIAQMEESLRQGEAKLRDCEAFMERYLRTGKFLRPMLFRNISGYNEIVH